MVRPENPVRLQIGKHIWLLHLWLNATFETFLKPEVPPNSRVGIKGSCLAKVTPDDEKVVSLEIYKDYF